MTDYDGFKPKVNAAKTRTIEYRHSVQLPHASASFCAEDGEKAAWIVAAPARLGVQSLC